MAILRLSFHFPKGCKLLAAIKVQKHMKHIAFGNTINVLIKMLLDIQKKKKGV